MDQNTLRDEIKDTGERMLPTKEGEVSIVFSRHKFAYEYVSSFVYDKKVIDIGCGSGYGSKILSEKAKLVYGIDYDLEAINYCKKNYSAPNLKYFNVDITKELKLDTIFDVAVCFQVIEHLRDMDEFLERIKKLVVENGTIFLTTPNAIEKDNKNPFHVNEMDYKKFKELISAHFTSFKILGIGYARKDFFRSMLEKTPIYLLGRALKRKSAIKKIVTKALHMTEFRIIETKIEEEAADLLAICNNIK